MLDDFTTKMEWFDDHKESYLRELITVMNLGCRMEFFMEYTEDQDGNNEAEEDEEKEDSEFLEEHGQEGGEWINENLHRISNLATAMRLVKTADLKDYLVTKLVQTTEPFERLKEMITTHRTAGTIPNLMSLGDTSTAAMVVHD